MSKNWIDVYVKNWLKNRDNETYKVCFYFVNKWVALDSRYETELAACIEARYRSSDNSTPWCVMYKKEKLALYIEGKRVEKPEHEH